MTDEIPPISPPIKERPPAVDGPPTSEQFDYLLDCMEEMVNYTQRFAYALEAMAGQQSGGMTSA